MTNVSDQVIEKIKTHILCSIILFFFFFSENHDIYEIKWTNVIDSERPETKIISTADAHCMLDK